MALVLDGSANTIGGLAVGGLPDGIVDTDMLATNAVGTAKIADNAVTAAKATGISPWTRNAAFSPPSVQVSEVVDVGSIPADAVEILVEWTDISSSGNEDLCFQFGTSGGIVTSGYNSRDSYTVDSGNSVVQNRASVVRVSIDASTSNSVSGYMRMHHVNGNVWVYHGMAESSNQTGRQGVFTGDVSLGGALTTIRFRCNGDSGFDTGTARVSWRV